MKMIEASIVSPDLKVGQYNKLQDVIGIEYNIEKRFSLHSIYGNGKILIDGSKHGSMVTCTNDKGEPANGVAGCLRNYLQVQSYSVSYQDGSGILYTDMRPENLLLFIKDLGMFSGFEVDKKVQESVILEGWQEEFIDKNSYIHTLEYQSLSKLRSKYDKEHDDAWDKYKEADDWLKLNGTPKPRDQWIDEDEFQSLLNNRPMSYKDEKRAQKMRSEKDKWIKVCLDAEKRSNDLREKMEAIKLNARNIEKREYSFSKPKKTSKTEFKGFKTETGIAYFDDRLAKGKAYIAEMPPKEYILRCAFQIFPEGTIESTVRACNDTNIHKYAAKMKSGEKFDMPYLDFTRGEQEGRHRAVAAMLNGYKTIPVLIM